MRTGGLYILCRRTDEKRIFYMSEKINNEYGRTQETNLLLLCYGGKTQKKLSHSLSESTLRTHVIIRKMIGACINVRVEKRRVLLKNVLICVLTAMAWAFLIYWLPYEARVLADLTNLHFLGVSLFCCSLHQPHLWRLMVYELLEFGP